MEHDIIYKKPVLKGFGGKLFEAIEERLQKIMKAHLLPAGYEFQKALDDYERLLSGKELVDRGSLKALAACDDNNARHELLERFRDYVLPNYDDLQSVFPEIRAELVAAVKAARVAKPRPIETRPMAAGARAPAPPWRDTSLTLWGSFWNGEDQDCTSADRARCVNNFFISQRLGETEVTILHIRLEYVQHN